MKWFKHISDSLDDPFISLIMDKFGSDGYLVFFGTLEIMARESNTNSPGKLRIPFTFMRRKLRVSRGKLVTILSLFQEKNRIYYEIEGDDIILNCPKLKELSDNWTKRKLRSGSEVSPKKHHPEEEVEEEVEESKKDTKTICRRKPKCRFSDADRETVLMFAALMKHNKPNRKPDPDSAIDRWANECRLMRERDGRSTEQIRGVMRYSQNDPFWKKNILSFEKLRKQFDRLEMEMKPPSRPKHFENERPRSEYENRVPDMIIDNTKGLPE